MVITKATDSSADSIQDANVKSNSIRSIRSSNIEKKTDNDISPTDVLNLKEDSPKKEIPETLEDIQTKPLKPVMKKLRLKPRDTQVSAPETKKEKSYDPLKARAFIEKQQAKRKEEKKSTVPNVAEKDLIKKRLEDLKRSTQVLVTKNVQKVRKRSLSAVPASSESQISTAFSQHKSKPEKAVPPKKPLSKSSSSTSPRTSPSTAQSLKSENNIRRRSALLKADFSQKIGIMRKPDASALGDVLVSPLKVVTPPAPEKQHDVISDIPTEGSPNEKIFERSISTVEKELKLDVPDVTLVPDTTSKQSNNVNVRTEFKSVPPWLKHTLLQPDPYPFIIAVRKKLEAIRNLNRDQTFVPEESVISHRLEDPPRPAKSGNNQKCIEYLESLKTVPYINKPLFGSESNIASISHRMSDSNTTSEISSIRSDFVLPLSSTKIDCTGAKPLRESANELENNPISPLSVERISNLKIRPDDIQVERTVNVTRGTAMPDAGLISDEKSLVTENLQTDMSKANNSETLLKLLRISSEKQNKAEKELDSQKMLEAFNRSLAQVIEVNQQLYSALKKTPEPSSAIPAERIKIRDEMTQTTPVPSATHTSVTSNYSEDFERSDHPQTAHEHPPKSGSSSGENVTDSTPSATSTTATASTTTTTTTAESSPENSPNKTESNTSHPSLESRSLSFSDSHNTNPPLPEEYLPSFEESLRNRPNDEKPTAVNRDDVLPPDTSSIHTQIGDESQTRNHSLRQEINESKSLESISLKISEESNIPNKTFTGEILKDSRIEIIKAPTESSTSSTAEALSSSKDTTLNDTTMGSDIMAMFNRTDLDVSVLSTSISETNLSYSSIGLYDQLIRSEKTKSEQLSSRARLKEKALLDRTKGQLAWLELQKQRFRDRGMMDQISVVKKKQRAILVRLERDRAELNRFKKEELSTQNNARSPITPTAVDKLNSLSSKSNSISLRKSSGSGKNDLNSSIMVALQQRKVTTMMTASLSTKSKLQLTAMRGVELEPNENLEDILTRREQELQKRRQHVQALLQWHQKLDREEQEILEIERNLIQSNRTKLNEGTPVNGQALGRIRSIEQSLQTLQQITGSGDGGDGEDHVVAIGSKLNRLWYRLTGVMENRYEPDRSYTLTRVSLESLYEQAKLKVLEIFEVDHGIRKILLEKSFNETINISTNEKRDETVPNNGNRTDTNKSSEELQESVDTNDGSSFRTTINSVTEKEPSDRMSVQDNDVEEQIDDEEEEERSSSLDVDDIISRVSDITENINGFLSSTTNIDELIRTEQNVHVSESVEFHTIEDEEDSEKRVKSTPDGYSSTFDAPTIEEQNENISPIQESQIMIEDISLPPLSDSILEESNSISSAYEQEKLSIDIPQEASLEDTSSTTSLISTPTTAEETEADQDDQENAVHSSELEKRLITLHDDLGGLSESLERVSQMRSPEARKEHVKQSSSESDPESSSPVEGDDYSSDKDFVVDDSIPGEQPFLNVSQTMRSAQVSTDSGTENHRIEIKIRNKNVNENFPHPSTSSGVVSEFSYLTLPANGSNTASSSPMTLVQNRMPDIINEAEVLRRQQLQIEQEIKQLEQQVVLFREIPNKPPPPYIPPANGSPLALIFPPESRIDELIETRTQHLFLGEKSTDLFGTDNVSNIYEKLILDMCKELYVHLRQPTPDVSFRTVQHDKRPLAFYNPPDTLTCLQDHIKRKIKRILNEESLLHHQQQQQNLQHCPMPFLMFTGSGTARRKRDQVDEILAQEMFEEEARWTTFDREEIEVKERIVEEVVKMMLSEALLDMEAAWKEKHDYQKDIPQITLDEEKVE
ncbi:centrosome-associated protein 350-like isoform X2 [Malaya genurostris]|nr:centrosome-associated protein 350-like isoform X2 [Malaya genurostris]